MAVLTRKRKPDADEVAPDPPSDLAITSELAEVIRPQSFERTLAGRRQATNEKRTTTKSKVLQLVNDGLTAAAAIMDPAALDAPAPNAVTRTWQHAAYGYVNTVGELNAGRMYVGNALSRCSLSVGKRNPDGSVEQGYDGEEPVEDLDNAVAAEAAEIISAIKSTRGGQSELLRSSGEKLFVAGEFYYVPEDTPQGMVFDILSTQELLRDGATWTKYLGPGYGAEPLPKGVNPIRVWRPDGQWSMLSTSSVRSCLEILEELVVLTRLVRSSAISRMALAGLLLIPDELDTPDEDVGPDGGMAEATNPLAVDMINTGAKAIDDPANASAWMPFIVQGPAEYLQHLRHIPFEASNQEQVIQRTEALQRLAQGLDLPVEVILGHMSTTFTNAQQISIDTFRIHLEPTLQLICDALTVAYLWPAMAKARGIDPDHLANGEPLPDDILSVAVTYDAHQLISAPDRTKELADVYTHDPTQMTIKIAEIRDALNLDPEEAPDMQEVAARVDAIRLTKIRETIVAPASDAAVGISQIDKAVVPGESEGAGLLASAGPPPVSFMVAGALDMTVARAVEKLGAKLRGKLKPEDKPRLALLTNAELPIELGGDLTKAMLGGDMEEALKPEINTLVAQCVTWLAPSDLREPGWTAHKVGILAVALVGSRVRGEVCGPTLDAVVSLLHTERRAE